MRVLNRKAVGLPKGAIYIGRPSTFGNPFRLGRDGDRGQVIRKFEKYFLRRVKADPSFRAQIEALRGRDLGCFCAPLPCHGEVIRAWLEGGIGEL